ncbi:MAG: hypothetical protein U0989_08270 [Azonexus sp.]|nr:hypothetical protein [Azonexus sp.]
MKASDLLRKVPFGAPNVRARITLAVEEGMPSGERRDRKDKIGERDRLRFLSIGTTTEPKNVGCEAPRAKKAISAGPEFAFAGLPIATRAPR